ncbi:MAG: ATP-binding cassette domain-containing protein [Acidobacteriota bacterium]
MAVIEVDGLRKVFHVHRKAPGFWNSVRALVKRQTVEKVAVKDVSFAVEEGEIVGLLGANGAGKTTVVKMLAGIVHPTRGDARVLGMRPSTRDDRLRRQMALIMGQKAQLWWDLPAADSFLLLKEIYQIPEARYREQLDQLAAMLQVEDELYVQLRRLSLGERMKMELIAALLHTPRVVYLDEPTIGLDLTAQRAVREFVLRYRREHAPAMLVTSHYMEDIERLCPRILILRQGELVYDGSLREVIARYARTKVVIAHLAPQETPVVPHASLAALGTVTLDDDGATLKLEVPRDAVTTAAARLLEHHPVLDLAIEDEPVGAVIERIQQAQGDEHAEDAVVADAIGARARVEEGRA